MLFILVSPIEYLKRVFSMNQIGIVFGSPQFFGVFKASTFSFVFCEINPMAVLYMESAPPSWRGKGILWQT
jgi:hypothetical protein